MNNYVLWLDDYRPVHPVISSLAFSERIPVVTAKNYEEFVAAIEERGCPRLISFDHDLADAHYGGDFSGPEKTGLDCAKWFGRWLFENSARLNPNFQFLVHSMNPVGAENITSYMEQMLAALEERARS